MPPNLINSSAVASANYYLGKNQKNLQQSLKRIASGKRINGPGDDPGSLSVSMKLNAQLSRISGVRSNIQNAISFLEVQDGALDTAQKIMNRMIELKGLSTQDPIKNAQEIDSYNDEFIDLQQQLHGLGTQKFNGVSLFATTTTRDGSTAAVFNNLNQNLFLDNTVEVIVSSEGNTGSKVSVNKSLLFSALTIATNDVSVSAAYSNSLNAPMRNQGESNAGVITFIAEDALKTIFLSDISMGVFDQALSNISKLRADNGSDQSQLNFAADNLDSYETGLRSAIGRIEDVDIAEESANLAKYSILTQASAAMVAQANEQSQSTMRLLLGM